MSVHTYKIQHLPLNAAQLKQLADSEGVIEDIVVEVPLNQIVDNDLEGFLDILSARVTGDTLLQDISYEVVGHDGNTLHISVAGDASMIIEEGEE